MSQSIGGKPPNNPTIPPAETNSANVPSAPAAASPSKPNEASKDAFSPATPPSPGQLPPAHSALANLPVGKQGGPANNLTSAELAQLSQLFAAIVQQYSEASRQERAKLFAKTILKQRALYKLFAKSSEADLEQMFDAISDLLDESPAYAELIDDVTNASRKPGKKKPSP